MKNFVFFLIIIVTLSTQVFAYDSKDLKDVEKEILTHKEISSKLDKQVKDNQKELKIIQDKSIKLANSIKNNSNEISEVKDDLEELDALIRIKEMQLEKNDENYKAILSSIIRISSIPANGFVIASNNPEELINARILLNSALPYLTKQTKKLHDDIKEIEKSKTTKSSKKQKLVDLSKNKEKEMNEIKSLLQEKNKLKSKLTASQKKERAELDKLAQKASSIKDFLTKLQERKLKPSKKPTYKESKIKFSKSIAGLPVSGKIVLGYGKKNPQNVTNYGWEIQSKANELVTCPLSGEVLYSGEFGSYDNIVVFDNGDGYNTILSGMEKISITVGDIIKAGEPVGFLGTSRKLYLEIRKNGNPINPSKVIK